MKDQRLKKGVIKLRALKSKYTVTQRVGLTRSQTEDLRESSKSLPKLDLKISLV